VEQFAIEILGKKIAARKPRLAQARKVGDERAAKLAFDVAIEEFAFEVAKDAVSMDRVISGDDAASRDRTDDVDLIQQPSRPSAHLERNVTQRLQRSVRQRRRSGTAARERDNEENVAWIVGVSRHKFA